MYSLPYITDRDQSSRQTQADVRQGKYDWSQTTSESNDLPFGEYLQDQHEKPFCLEDGQGNRDTITESHLPSTVARNSCIFLKYYVAFPVALVARHSTNLPVLFYAFHSLDLRCSTCKYLLESPVYVKMKQCCWLIICKISKFWKEKKKKKNLYLPCIRICAIRSFENNGYSFHRSNEEKTWFVK